MMITSIGGQSVIELGYRHRELSEEFSTLCDAEEFANVTLGKLEKQYDSMHLEGLYEGMAEVSTTIADIDSELKLAAKVLASVRNVDPEDDSEPLARTRDHINCIEILLELCFEKCIAVLAHDSTLYDFVVEGDDSAVLLGHDEDDFVGDDFEEDTIRLMPKTFWVDPDYEGSELALAS